MNAIARLVVLLLVALPSFAGRPLSTEDASVLADKSCQLEAWLDRGRDATEAWLVPACNFGAGLEWQVGGARRFESGTAGLEQAYAQVKTVFRSVDEHPWGAGLVLGLNRLPRRETRTDWGDPYVIVPVSFKVSGSDALLHFNAGWLRDRADRRDLTVWGVALEIPVSERLTLLGETFGENSSKPFFRAGGRYVALPDRLEFDLTFVTRGGSTSADRFVSLGLAYKTDAFLP